MFWLVPFVLTEQHTTQTSMLLAGFKPAISASERPQANALERAAAGIGRFDPRTTQPAASRDAD
jgi:hypothetical protein